MLLIGELVLPYFVQFMQQWKMYLKQQFSRCGLSYVATDAGDSVDIKANSLAYFSWLRTTCRAGNNFDESRDGIAWMMLEKQLKALAEKAEKGTFDLVSKLHLEESQIQIVLNFSYDDEQHIVYVS
tara:strand:- start:18354 stop:18731 length:378 start_codon:yes stop_codon:yes gene_type:complete